MEEQQEPMLSIVPNPRVVIDTQIHVLKRQNDLTEEERQEREEERKLKSLMDPEYSPDNDYPGEDDFEWLNISLDFSTVTAVSPAEEGLATLWFGMDNSIFNIEYGMALALFHGEITLDDILDAINEEE